MALSVAPSLWSTNRRTGSAKVFIINFLLHTVQVKILRALLEFFVETFKANLEPFIFDGKLAFLILF